MTTYKIPVYQPDRSGKEKRDGLEYRDSTWLSVKDRFIAEFENECANFVGVTYAVEAGNGTVALHLARVTLGIGPGDEVIVPTLTSVAG